MINIDIRTNADAFATIMSRAPEVIRHAVSLGIEDIADAIGTLSSERCPVGKSKPGYIGGTLRSSLTVRKEEGHAVVGYHTPYARIVHDGVSSPFHVQVPAHTRTQTMVWGVPIKPRVVRVRAHKMLMPVRPAKPYLLSAVKDIEPRMAMMVGSRIDDALVELGGEALRPVS